MIRRDHIFYVTMSKKITQAKTSGSKPTPTKKEKAIPMTDIKIAETSVSKVEVKAITPPKPQTNATKVPEKESAKKEPKIKVSKAEELKMESEKSRKEPTLPSNMEDELPLFWSVVDVKQRVTGAPKNLQKCPECGNYQKWFLRTDKNRDFYEVICTPCYEKDAEAPISARVD